MEKTNHKPVRTNAKPVKYSDAEWAPIEELRNRTNPKLSASEIQRRACRYAVPLMLSGELPISDSVLLPARSTRSKKRTKKSAVPA